MNRVAAVSLVEELNSAFCTLFSVGTNTSFNLALNGDYSFYYIRHVRNWKKKTKPKCKRPFIKMFTCNKCTEQAKITRHSVCKEETRKYVPTKSRVRHSGCLSLTDHHPANLSFPLNPPSSLKTLWLTYICNVCMHYHLLTDRGVTMDI